MLWVVAIVSLTTVSGDRFYNQPMLDVGTRSPDTIRAPFSISIEDTKATEEKRQAALQGSTPVLMWDREANEQIYESLEVSISQVDKARSLLESFPFVKTSVLSATSQSYLRQVEEQEWQAIKAAANSVKDLKQPLERGLPQNLKLNSAFAQAVKELISYRAQNSPKAYSTLIEAIERARQNYARAVALLLSPSDVALLKLSKASWQQTQTGIHQATDRIVTQGIPPGLPPEILQPTIKLQLNSLVPAEVQPVSIELLMGILKPNLIQDPVRTKQLALQAAGTVPPEILTVRQGEEIVRAGEVIDQTDFLLLDRSGLSRRSINWLSLLGFAGIVTSAVGIFWLVSRRVHPRSGGKPLRRRDYILILILSLSVPLLSRFGAKYTDLPTVGWLVGGFYSPVLGIASVSLLTGLVGSGIKSGWDYLLAGSAGGLLAAALSGKMRSREEQAFLGGGVGLTQGAVYFILNSIANSVTGVIGGSLTNATVCGLLGLAACVLALGISPYLEHFFDLITPIRLAELSNPNRPLLKRLASETPGTFQHTIFVANLAEAAARELGGNVELVRAGTLYHDIGKMHDPLAFIENQMGGANKHDEINDPWVSAEIIKKHVSEGLVMARKHRLPKAIQAFIPEHQGTIAIAYFYHQAQQLAQEDPTIVVREEDFRYAGPIPQSRETGIVMLADACEAALRTLKDATPEIALSTIDKIFRARWRDGQLLDSQLKREELSQIAEIFVRVWLQSNHQRIAYPTAIVLPK
ncbi:MAG: HDIG domain-containing protein [Cyanosarcina radialis HA8281-LM2]|jgi:hypothetical protein|nr:HDIG domain-containing protein [Cyanosarcina radialis HA8281-LM2]